MEFGNCMRQEEFLVSFQEALTGEVSDRIVQEHVTYYKNYINQQISMGVTEQEVMLSLGNPRLLAKTIIDSSKYGGDTQETYGYQSAYSQNSKTQEYTRTNTYQSHVNDEDMYNKKIKQSKVLNIPSWLMGIIGVLFMALLIGLAFCVISYLAPIILFFTLIGLACSLIRKFTRGY